MNLRLKFLSKIQIWVFGLEFKIVENLKNKI